MLRCWWLVLTVLLAYPMTVDAQEDAKEVIRKAILAAKMPQDDKTYHETWREKGKMTAMGMTIPYDAQWAFEAPGKYRFAMKMTFQGQNMEMLFVQNGVKAKESAMGQSRALEGEKLEETTHSAYQFWVISLRPLFRETGFTLTLLPSQMFAGQPVTSVKVSRQGKRDVTLHFDKRTNLLAGCSDRVKDEFQNWKDVPQVSEFSGYTKGTNGEMNFTKMVVKRDGKVMLESQLSEYQRSEKLQGDLFKLD
jgi:hypothetical protein